jgi:hypothetical protein
MNGYNPMLAYANDEPVGKNYVVVAKSDDDRDFYVLSESAQTTLSEYEKGKKINTKGNPIIDKYEKFMVGGKEYYGVDAEKYGAVTSANSQWFDMYRWEYDPATKEAKYYKGKTELSKAYDNMEPPKEFEGYLDAEAADISDIVDPNTIPSGTI